MEDMLVRQFDLIALNPSSTSNLLEPESRATKMGIPLINVNDAYISPEDQEKHNVDIISFISHRLQEMPEICHRMVVLRDGSLVGNF